MVEQDLADRLAKLHDAIQEQNRKENDGTIHVPAHLVNLKISNKQKVMLPDRASFGPMSMARIVAKAGLFRGRGEEGVDAGTRVDEDDFYLMKLQHDRVSGNSLVQTVHDIIDASMVGCMCVVEISGYVSRMC
jgi:hypothetical protein